MAPEPSTPQTSAVLTVTSSSAQFLTFMLSGEEYGVDILRVQEIKGWESATEIPNMPDYIRGVINLRGTIVPIVDLRRRFGMANIEYTSTTVIIVLMVKNAEGAQRTMGFVVDAVSDVYSVGATQIKPPPDFGEQIRAECVRGLATVDEKMIILLDIDQLIGSDPVFDPAAETRH
jgi:purine-binding chemotaxis protein CheW